MHIENCLWAQVAVLDIYILDYIALFGTRYTGFRQVLYLGRAPRIKETLPDLIKVASDNPTSTCIPQVDG